MKNTKLLIATLFLTVCFFSGTGFKKITAESVSQIRDAEATEDQKEKQKELVRVKAEEIRVRETARAKGVLYLHSIEAEEEKPEPEMTLLGEYTLTAYCATGNPCADGFYPQVGYTVACNDPSLWHKKIHIAGHGDFYVHDTGGMPSNSIIDVFVGSYDEAINFGVQTAEVYLIDE